MEMPVKCECGQIFDLDDGFKSETCDDVICEKCYKEHAEEQDRQEEIDDLNETIENAEFDIKESRKRLIELKALSEDEKIIYSRNIPTENELEKLAAEYVKQPHYDEHGHKGSFTAGVKTGLEFVPTKKIIFTHENYMIMINIMSFNEKDECYECVFSVFRDRELLISDIGKINDVLKAFVKLILPEVKEIPTDDEIEGMAWSYMNLPNSMTNMSSITHIDDAFVAGFVAGYKTVLEN